MTITTTFSAHGREMTLGESERGRSARGIQAVNEETGELAFADQTVTRDQLSAAFAQRERTAIRLAEWKEEGKRIKVEDEEAQHTLIRLGRRMRRGRD